MTQDKQKCNGDCFNCTLPVSKCKGQPSNSKSAYKRSPKPKHRNVGVLPNGPASIRPGSYSARHKGDYD